MTIKLYYAPGTCALACWIALAWAGADFSVEKVNPRSDSYQAINPLGLVPAIDIGESRAFTQANAILQYIADSYPQADLGANDGVENHLKLNEIMAFLTGDFHPAFWLWFAPQRFTVDTSDAAKQAVKDASHERIDRVMTHLNNIIGASGVHVYQNKRTIADAYAYIMASWSKVLPKTWRDYPNINRFMLAMEKDETVQAVMSAAQNQQ